MSQENFNHFPEIALAIHRAISQAVRKTAFDIQARAASSAPVDTSFLRNSIYVVTIDANTYGATPTRKGSYLLPPVGPPVNDLEAYAGVGANYGIYLEMGTRFMAARPYFYSAVDACRASFEAALSAIGNAF